MKKTRETNFVFFPFLVPIFGSEIRFQSDSGIWCLRVRSGTEMASNSKTYVFEEVNKHAVTNDCWLIIHGKVYDVTPFMEDHPGGSEVLLAATGKDATTDYDDIGHSKEAQEMLDQYYIGKIDASTVPQKRQFIPSQVTGYTSLEKGGFSVKILQILLPLIILGLAFAVRSWTKKD
ncbi:cytochrome b5-like [Magnolia sinica]|uniref:cytochrome b5-like n=1 Tax=Magnolia sinica TaxID=86752 RepID=UPI00265A5D36|nr:cytochrome b5-like [Magnolia sinica]